MEDNAKIIINVAGDYVQSKYVEYEIANVEPTGIGIQIVNGSKSAITTATVRVRTPKLQTATFTYRYWQKSTMPITQLYQCLLQAKWIAADTNPDDFLAILSGADSTARVKCIGKPSYLYGLIRRAVEQALISIPTNAKLWQIVESHFVDSNSRSFHNFHKQKESKTAIPTIETMLKILQPSA
jgi:hypothetical protein